MKMKKVLCYALSIITVISMVFAFSACNSKNDAEEPTEEVTTQDETTSETENTEKTEKETTEKAEKTTEQKKETTTEATNRNTTEKHTEVTKHTETTAKYAKPTTRKKQETTTRKSTVEVTKTSKITTEKNDDLSKLGKAIIDPARAGRYYNENGNQTTLDKIGEGEMYYYYDKNGNREALTKPYSEENEPTTQNTDVCPECGKSHIGVGEHYACASGGCSRWACDIDCPECGEFVPAWTCHTCTNPTRVINSNK